MQQDKHQPFFFHLLFVMIPRCPFPPDLYQRIKCISCLLLYFLFRLLSCILCPFLPIRKCWQMQASVAHFARGPKLSLTELSSTGFLCQLPRWAAGTKHGNFSKTFKVIFIFLHQLGPSGPSWSSSRDAHVFKYLSDPFPCNFFRMAEAVSETRFTL